MSFAIDLLVTDHAWDRCLREVVSEQRRWAGAVPVYPWEAPPTDPRGWWWLGPEARIELRAGDEVLRLVGSARWLVEGLRTWLADGALDGRIEGESVWQTPDVLFTVRGEEVDVVVGVEPAVHLCAGRDAVIGAAQRTLEAFDGEFESRLRVFEALR